ncbi:MAG: DUF6768 family protein [Pseudomonadota bacterium]
MTDIDAKLTEALRAKPDGKPFQEPDGLSLAGNADLTLLGQFKSLFTGPGAWMAIIILIIGTVVTFWGLYAAWKFATVDDPTAMVRWGGLAWALFTTQIMLKLWSWLRMETNRSMRETKRLELQVALLRDKLESVEESRKA